SEAQTDVMFTTPGGCVSVKNNERSLEPARRINPPVYRDTRWKEEADISGIRRLRPGGPLRVRAAGISRVGPAA
ncbi:MAG: hypothetical protein ABFD90_05375, partial [Phycisphaerales bacterium]